MGIHYNNISQYQVTTTPWNMMPLS